MYVLLRFIRCCQFNIINFVGFKQQSRSIVVVLISKNKFVQFMYEEGVLFQDARVVCGG